MKVDADMYNFLGPDIASEIPLEIDRSGICIGHLKVIKHLKASLPRLHLQLCCLLKSLQATYDGSKSEFLICDIVIEHQNSSVDCAPLYFMKSWCSPALRLHFDFVSCSMY